VTWLGVLTLLPLPQHTHLRHLSSCLYLASSWVLPQLRAARLETVQPGAVTHKSSGDGGQRHYSFPGGSLDTLEPVPDWVKLCAHLYPSLPGKSLLHLGESSSTGSIPHPALKLCPAVVLSALCGLQVTTSLQLLPSAGPCHYRQVLECVPGNQSPCSQLGWIIWAKGNPPPLYLEAMAALCEPDLVVCASDRCQEGAECSISDQRSAISDQRSAISDQISS
jgi:hypothetical protein